jgi:hypothetical protein
MAANTIRFVLLLLVALLVGTMIGIWIGFNPASLSASAYVEQQQNAIHALNVLMPATGAACIVLTLVLAFMAEGDPRTRYSLVAVAALLVVAALITRFGNQPINANRCLLERAVTRRKLGAIARCLVALAHLAQHRWPRCARTPRARSPWCKAPGRRCEGGLTRPSSGCPKGCFARLATTRV